MNEENNKSGELEADVVELTDNDFLEGKIKPYIAVFRDEDIEGLLESKIEDILSENGGGLSWLFCFKRVGNHIEIYPIKKLEIYC